MCLIRHCKTFINYDSLEIILVFLQNVQKSLWYFLKHCRFQKRPTAMAEFRMKLLKFLLRYSVQRAIGHRI